MKLKATLSFILLLINYTLFSQDFNWVAAFQGSFDDLGTDVVTDSNGNIYAVGQFENSIDFDPGSGFHYMNELNNDKGNVYCIKLSPTGNLIWAHQVGGDFGVSVSSSSAEDIQPKIALDNANNVYITGLYDHNVDFDTSSSSTYFIPNPTLASSTYHFVCKLDTNGNFIWAKQVGADNILSSIFRSIEVDQSGNIYLAGHFNNTVDFDPGPSTFNLTTDNSTDIFYMKLDTNGNFAWAKQIGNLSDNDRAKDMSIDGQHLYLTGYYRGLVDFDTGSGIAQLQSANDGEDAFIAKYDLANGNYVWAQSIGSSNGSDVGYAIQPDSQGNVYASGSFRGTIDFNADPSETFNMSSIGTASIYLLKLNGQGEFIWARNFGAVNGSNSSSERPFDLAINSTDGVYLSGYFLNQMDCDPSAANEFMISSNGNWDIFALQISNEGNFVWAENFGGSSSEYPYQIAIGPDDKLVVTGKFGGDVDFNPSGGNQVSHQGAFDSFILKLDTSTLSIDSTNSVGNFTAYPNPSSDLLHVSSKDWIKALSIYDINGKLLQSKKLSEVQQAYPLNVEDLAAGIYFLEIQSANAKQTLKFVKE